MHLPIQSATNEILSRMRRKYTLDEYHNYLMDVFNNVPDICLGTDVIVGFPGETNDLFLQTKRYLESSPIHYFHVFSYSERTMAHSRKFDTQIPKQDIKERSASLRHLHDHKWQEFLNQFTNRTVPVLFEQVKGDYWVGSTEHFIKVKVKSNKNLKNNVLNVVLKQQINNEMIGQLNE